MDRLTISVEGPWLALLKDRARQMGRTPAEQVSRAVRDDLMEDVEHYVRQHENHRAEAARARSMLLHLVRELREDGVDVDEVLDDYWGTLPAVLLPIYEVEARWAPQGWELHIDHERVTQSPTLEQAARVVRDYLVQDGEGGAQFNITVSEHDLDRLTTELLEAAGRPLPAHLQ